MTGIFVLDENFSVLAHYDKAGKDESLLLSQIIGDKMPADILNYPQKTYADQICINDNTYNYAISARRINRASLFAIRMSRAFKTIKMSFLSPLCWMLKCSGRM